jgi:hypothetical protein
MGHKRWVLAFRHKNQWGIDFCLCLATTARGTSENCCSVIVANGVGESPPYFCTATKTSHNIATTYCKTKMGTLPSHKFDDLVSVDDAVGKLLDTPATNKHMQYLIEVYVDNFMAIVIPTTRHDITHVGRVVMHKIHEVFPTDDNNANTPVSKNKLLKGEGVMSTTKTILGFDFDGVEKTMWLESAKRDQLLMILHSWI